jgi:hypothetical protein
MKRNYYEMYNYIDAGLVSHQDTASNIATFLY